MVRFNALAGLILLTGCSGTSVADYIPFGGDSSEPTADAELVGDVDVAEVAVEAAEELKKSNIKLLIEPINTFDMPGFFLSSSQHAVETIMAVQSTTSTSANDL